MAKDRTETRNVAAAHPEVVRRMGAQYEAWAKNSFVDVWPKLVPGGVVKGKLEGGTGEEGARAAMPRAEKKAKKKAKKARRAARQGAGAPAPADAE